MRIVRLAVWCSITSTIFSVLPAMAEWPAPRRVDERRAGQVAIRKIVGRHLRLYTDLPASNAVGELPVVFDAAVEQWAKYFGVPAERVDRWKMQAYLIEDRDKFAALGLMPEANPNFENGYAQGYELWLMEQPSAYYRRHLLLHEGTHGFMYTQLGDAGPGWYMEGTAELLGTHRWEDGKLELGYMPADRNETPMWGRIKLIREASRAGQAMSLRAVMGMDNRRVLATDQYAWCWALSRFLDSDPLWRERFRQLPEHVGDLSFDKRFFESFPADRLGYQWHALVAALDYGYDFERMSMQDRDAQSLGPGERSSVAIKADRGWQATGWKLLAGQEYQVTAKGRYQVASESQPWPSEPGGITVEYHDGKPLGVLLGAFVYDAGDTFSAPTPIGLGTTLRPEQDAVLYLRVNDSPARLSDNEGTLDVTIARE